MGIGTQGGDLAARGGKSAPAARVCWGRQTSPCMEGSFASLLPAYAVEGGRAGLSLRNFPGAASSRAGWRLARVSKGEFGNTD